MLATTISMTPFIQGFLLCAGTIVTLGPQNLFILKQGLRRQHVFATAFFSTLARTLLIALALGGLSASLAVNHTFSIAIQSAGVVFLTYAGGTSLLRAVRNMSASPTLASQPAAPYGVRMTIVAALCFAFFNPAIYMNTLMVIGTSSLSFSMDERLVFGVGAVMAAATWFFLLSYGASQLTSLLRSSLAWRALDGVSGIVMLGIASTLLITLIGTL